MAKQNPFRIHGTVEGEYFTNRQGELEKFAGILSEPAAKMVVYGPRRMGKSSTLDNVVRSINKGGGHALIADISTASTVTDIGNRILASATRSIGKGWRDLARDLVGRLQGSIRLAPDPTTGFMLPSFDVGLRQASLEAQRESLAQVLDGLEALAASKKTNVGLVLDEFQDITKFGGQDAEWHLRGIVQRHKQVSYIFAGSEEHLIRAMLGSGRAFYKMLDQHHFGPIDRDHMSSWIDQRMQTAGLTSSFAGAACVNLTGPRTRDIVQLARKCVDRAVENTIGYEEVAASYVELIEDQDDSIRNWWDTLTSLQQNVLRAAAGSSAGLTTADTRKRFSLESSGSITNAAAALLDEGHLVRTDSGSGYVFDSPFVRGWVIIHALPDIGVELAATHIASETAEYLAAASQAPGKEALS
ncbi:MAG TPA: ATP-binding protein [Gemmatimonadaceae bacterium]|nr:ATP-binding protein [Gemmatimonadaceae bacterium]